MKRKSLSQRIFWWMAFVGLLPLLLITVQGYYWIMKDIKGKEKEHLVSVLESRYICSTRIFEGLMEDFFTLGSSLTIEGNDENQVHIPDEKKPQCLVLDALRNREKYYKAIFIYDAEWKVIAGSKNIDDADFHPPSELKNRLLQNNDLNIYNDLVFNTNSVIIQAGQAFDHGDSRVNIIAVLDLHLLASRLTKEGDGLGKTGKIYVLSRDNRYIAPPRDSIGLVGEKSTIPGVMISEPGRFVLRYLDWRGIPVMGVSALFPQIDMLLVAEISEAEVFELPRQLVLSVVFISLFTLVIIFFISSISSRSLSSSLRQLARVTKTISSGNYKERAPNFADTETQEVGEAFNQMLDQLEVSQRAVINTASLAAVGELSSSLAHEMKNPLSSIKINLQTLGKKISGDKVYSEMADISLQQVQRLEMMLTELLNYSKPLKLKPERLSFTFLSRKVMQTIGQKIKQKGLTLEIDDQLDDINLYVDRELMVRALTSLIENAAQWSPPNGKITLSGRKMPDGKSWLMIQVADEGPGIQERHRKRLFLPFFTTRPEGTGLGLTNVRKIIEHHGGMIFAEKNTGRGAFFTIHLPLTEFEV